MHHLPDASTATNSSNPRLVTVYATVRDGHGKVVPALTRNDFLVEEDGRAQTISIFVGQTDAPLTIGLLIDTTSSQRALLISERDSSYTFLDRLLTGSDAAFLIHFDRDVELLQDVTSSRAKLQSGLQLLSTPPLNRGDDDASGADEGRRGFAERRHLYDAIWLASNELMKKRPGRKALFVVSSGVDRGSRESLTDALEAAQRADAAVYTIYFAGDESQQGYERRRRWGANGPAGWPGGGGGNPYPTEPRVNGKKILLQISEQTGGMMFELSKKLLLDRIYSAAAEGLRNQYSIGYAPNPPDADSSYHTIHLGVRQKGLQVQARQGYYSGR
ncbi:MAG: VWA domain-containing protein [Acidobacteriota bacterium]|nr:VWA domain-containing protein [Acidobacteriota bacterium]